MIRYLNTVEVKKRFGVHRHTVINWIKSGKIKQYTLINQRYYIPLEEVERLESEGFVMSEVKQ